MLELAEAPVYLPDLMAAKAEAESKLAERSAADAALHDLLVRTRLASAD
ncbi:hypothetical protein [Streptomyces sp. SID13031]|nr:hypothetical protein [Streptomyces sp. SID13031]